MAAHTYWRINVSANNGDTSYLVIAEIEMRGSISGADQCTGGTASASTAGGGAAAGAFADDGTTTLWATTLSTTTGWIRYQFAAAVDVLEYTIQAPATLPATRSPKTWALEYSDDGTTWVQVETRENITGWTASEIKTYAVVLTADARVSQVPVEVLRLNTGVVARASQVAAEVLRINTGTVIRSSQIAVEALRPNVAAASTGRPQRMFVCT